MPRRYRRSSRRNYNNSGILVLVVLLLGAVVLLYLLGTGRVTAETFNIPITGPSINVPTFELPLSMDGEPDIRINDTPFPSGGSTFGDQTKTSGCLLQGSLPDPACTPGAAVETNSDAVCAAGYTNDGGAGPSANEVFAAYGVTADGSYQVDHLVPLSLGGSNSAANLWTMPVNSEPGPVEKDRAEEYLHEQVCAGNMTLAEAQRQIAVNWLVVYNNIP